MKCRFKAYKDAFSLLPTVIVNVSTYDIEILFVVFNLTFEVTIPRKK